MRRGAPPPPARAIRLSTARFRSPSYELSAYASAFHIVGLKAVAALADHAQDSVFAAECRAQVQRAQASMDALQWTGDHYAAGSSGCTAGKGCAQQEGVFSDAFYAQVLAYDLGLGDVLRVPVRLDTHLRAVRAHNCLHTDVAKGTYKLVPGCPNGLITMTGRKPGVSDLQIWQMATNDQAALEIYRSRSNATAVTAALELARGQAEAYTKRTNDQWNIAGITLNDGHSSITSHYGYHMTLWHIPRALSGMDLDLSGPRSHLAFTPAMPPCTTAPFQLPWFSPGRLGSIGCNATHARLSLSAGSPLSIDALSLGASRYPEARPTVAVGRDVVWGLTDE